jgi:hypothetical protein
MWECDVLPRKDFAWDVPENLYAEIPMMSQVLTKLSAPAPEFLDQSRFSV